MNYSLRSIRKRRRAMQSTPAKLTHKAFVVFFKLVVVAFAVTCIMLTCVGIGAFTGIIQDSPQISIDSITPSGYQTNIYDSKGNKLETLVASGANRIEADISSMPEHLLNAFIAIEDFRFYEHNGIDPIGIVRAAYKTIKNKFKSTQGASTITQQLIKNNIFSAENENGLIDIFKRKFQEQYLALILEQNVSKSVILQNYLNTINLGNNNLGVEAAALNYFGKHVSELTLSESTVIAAITSNPYDYNPVRRPERNAIRREVVLNNMLKYDMITKEEYDEALADNVYDRIVNMKTTSGNSSSAYSYYTDALIKQLMDDLINIKGYTQTQAYNLIYRGGLTIYSCEDKDLQTYAEKAVNNVSHYSGRTDFTLRYRIQIKDRNGDLHSYTEVSILKYYQSTLGMSGFSLLFSTEEEALEKINTFKKAILEETGGTVVEGTESITYTLEPQASFVLMEQSTGCVRAIVGGRGDKNLSLVLNRATDSTRSPGSSFKLLSVYSAALDTAGMTLATVFDDVPYLYSTGKLVTNVDDEYHGLMTIREAITVSRNVPAVKIITAISPELGYSYAANFGITTLKEEEQHYQAIALGGLTNGATNFEMTAAYAAISNYGVYNEPKLYTRVLDHDGTILLDNTPAISHRVIKESTAWLLCSALRSVVTDNITYLMSDNMYYAGKSGTSQLNTDKWFVGFSPYYTAGIWIGNDDSTPVNSDIYQMPQLSIWKDIMEYAHEGLEYAEFQRPFNIVEAKVCAKSGKLAISGLCDCDPRGDQIITEYFVEGTVPTEICDVHMRVSMCRESGCVAGEKCPPGDIYQDVFVLKDLSDIGDLEQYIITDLPYVVTPEMLYDVCPLHGNSKNYNYYDPRYHEEKEDKMSSEND